MSTESQRRQMVEVLRRDDDLRVKVIGMIRALADAWAALTPAQQAVVKAFAVSSPEDPS